MTEKKLDGSIYNEKSLHYLNIRDLRVIGRGLGVSAPSSKKKQELIDEILNVVYGRVTPKIGNSYGRPSTHELDMEKYISKIKKHSELYDEVNTYKYSTETTGYNLGFGLLSSPSSEYKINDNIEKRCFCEDDGKYYLRVRSFIRSKDDIEVLPSLKEKYNLVENDILEIAVVDDYYKIITINGIKIKNKIGQLIVDNTPLVWGKKQDFYLSTKEELEKSINILSKECEKNDIKLIVFSKKSYDGSTTLAINYSLDEDKSQTYQKFMLFLQQCEKAIYDGEDIIVALEDYNEIDGIISKCDPDIYERTQKYFQEVTSRVVELGNICIKLILELDFKY